MILLWVLLALLLTAMWGVSMLFTAVMGMDDDSRGTRVAQVIMALVFTAILGVPALLTWRHIAGFER